MASLNMQAQNAGNAILIQAVKSDPENALPLLISVGYTEEDAKKVIAGVQSAILEDEKAESLAELKTELVDSLTNAGNELWEGNFIPEEIEVMHIDVSFYAKETTLAGGQIVKPGFFVGMIKAHFTGVEKPVVIGRAAVAKGGTKKANGGNGHRKVNHPDGTPWAQHYRANYPEDAANYFDSEGKALPGKSINTTLRLKALKDPVYMEAAGLPME